MISRGFRQALISGLIFLALPACQGKPPSSEGVVATLSGKPISSDDLRESARFIGLEALASRPLSSWSSSQAGLVLRETVYDRLLEEKGKEIGVEVSPDEVAAEKKRLEETGAPSRSRSPYSPPDSFIRRKLLLEKVSREVAPAPDVTLRELKDDYKSHLPHYTLPERAEAKDIVVRSEDEGKAILSALAAGSSFSALAKAKSLSPEGKNGGLLPPFAMGEMPPPFNRLFSMKPGEISPLIASPYGYHILKLVRMIPAHVRKFSSVKGAIRKKIVGRARRKELADWLSKELHRNPLVILPRYRSLLSFRAP
jgi:peptidyl-prolyl cis-trans isomerase C